MKTKKSFYLSALAVGVAALIAACAMQLGDEPSSGATVRIDADDIGGVVTSAKGPEAGVWVIAETTELPTKFSRTVVTDDRGRYLVPDLPKANYSVWVRGYGLVDSPKVQAAPGRALNLTAVTVPDKGEFPGTGASGNGINENIRTQAHWLRMVKTDSCESCHQMGNKGTREI